MNRFLIAILASILCTSVFGADGFSSLEEQMTGKEYTAAGLNKLTPEELAALNNWIRIHSVATLDKPKAGSSTVAAAAGTENGDTRGFDKKSDDEDRTPITSRIIGSFSGWDGHAIFKLENGMIWEQDDKDKFYIREIQNPEVTIKPGMFGSWHLSVEGYSSKCRVERLQ
jgi:hypothetical protein